MTIRFNLKSKKDFSSLILMKIHLPNERLPFTMSTGQKILIEFWDDRKMRARHAKAFPQAMWLNALLSKYETLALDCIRQSLVEEGHLPTSQQIKEYLSAAFSHGATKQTFFGYFSKSIEEKKKDPQLSRHTVKQYVTTLNNLIAFAKQTKRSDSFSALNREWFDSWQSWNFGNDKSRNTIAGYWSKAKAVLNAAVEDGFIKPAAFNHKSLAITFQRADEVFLTSDELMALYHLDLYGSHLEIVRDIFLLDAFSGGFRFADMANLDSSNIVPMLGVRTMKLHTRKTDTPVYTPASWYLDEFLEKYGGKFPKMKVSQVFNRQIKKVVRMAGITRPTELRQNKGGVDIYVKREKCEWVTQYTARYSFATNLFLAGVGIEEISILLGHSKISTTQTYIKSKQLATVMAMAKNPYFTTKPAATR